MHQIPLTLREANSFVRAYHRRSVPTVGCRFALGVEENNKIVGIAICGRPVARLLDDKRTLEVLRVRTDGTKNANSFLYDKCRKIGALMGYRRIITYTLEKESGSSLRAIDASPVEASAPRRWDRAKRPRKDQAVYFERKVRWDLRLIP